jgi:hypothetical protein
MDAENTIRLLRTTAHCGSVSFYCRVQSFRATRLRFPYSRPAPHLSTASSPHPALRTVAQHHASHFIRSLPLSSRKQAATDHEPTARNSQQRFCLAYRRPPPPPHVALAGQLQHTHLITKFLVQSYLNAVHDEHLAYVAPGMIARLDKTRSSYRKEKAIWWSKRQNASYPPPTTITRIPVQSGHR